MMYYLITLLIKILIIAPICEWGFHYILHKSNNQLHKRYHSSFQNSHISIRLFIPIMVILYYFKLYLCFFICVYYMINYYFIYRYIKSVNSLDYHLIHHLNPEYNYGITTSWVDKLFGTEFKIKKK